jgi:hypothetical protein
MAHRWYEQLFGTPEPAYIRGKPSVPRSGDPEVMAAAKEKARITHAQSMKEGRESFQLDVSDPENHRLMSKANGTWYNVGKLTTPSLKELRARVAQHGQRCARPPPPPQSKSDVTLAGIYIVHDAVGDVLPLHAQNPHATFQAASQMNCLEFPNQYVSSPPSVLL